MLENIDIRILVSRRDDLKPLAWNWNPLPNDFWRLYQIDRNGATISWEGRDIPLERNAVYIIPPDLTILTRNENFVRQFYIHFDVRGVAPAVLQGLFDAPRCIPDKPHFKIAVTGAAEQVVMAGVESGATQCLLKAIILEAIGIVLSEADAETMERTQLQSVALRDIEPALHHIQARYCETIRIEELAKLCGLSEGYFIQRFRTMVGMTPLAYIQNRRIAEAAHLLLTTELSIESIADLTGFNDRFYFSRIFARETGSTPAVYRNDRHRVVP